METGLKNRKELVVTFEMTAQSQDPELPAVFSTPDLVKLMEHTCSECIKPFFEEGQGSVGTAINIRHTGATPVGMKLYCECELIEVKGKKLVFDVKAFDEEKQVGSGTHTRAIINMKAFIESLQK